MLFVYWEWNAINSIQLINVRKIIALLSFTIQIGCICCLPHRHLVCLLGKISQHTQCRLFVLSDTLPETWRIACDFEFFNSFCRWHMLQNETYQFSTAQHWPLRNEKNQNSYRSTAQINQRTTTGKAHTIELTIYMVETDVGKQERFTDRLSLSHRAWSSRWSVAVWICCLWTARAPRLLWAPCVQKADCLWQCWRPTSATEQNRLP